MGNAYSSSHTKLGKGCSSYEAGPSGTITRLGDFFEISMSKRREDNDQTDVWGVQYTAGEKKHSCGYQLRGSFDNTGVESILLGLSDTAENTTEFSLKITRVGFDGLRGGIIGIISPGSPKSFTRDTEDCTIETTIVSYGCSFREGLFVLEMKRKVDYENAYMATLAHYYVAKDVGVSVAAKVYRKKGGSGFIVEVEGPFKHPSSDLRKVLVLTSRTGVWSPGACSHCKSSTGGDSNSSSLKVDRSHTVWQIIKRVFFSRNVREQHNKGLINSSGHTTGSLNHSVIFMNCEFLNS